MLVSYVPSVTSLNTCTFLVWTRGVGGGGHKVVKTHTHTHTHTHAHGDKQTKSAKKGSGVRPVNPPAQCDDSELALADHFVGSNPRRKSPPCPQP